MFLASGLILGSVAVCLGAVELVFLGYKERYSAWWSYGAYGLHNQRIYSIVPNHSRTWTTAEFAEAMSSNQDGLRGPELRQGPRTWTRVLLLGDSFTYGHGASEGESYPARLADLFRRDGSDVEVVNGGVPGYGTDQQHAYFTQALYKLEPDVLVVGLNLNDVDDNIGRPLYSIQDGELTALDATKNAMYFTAVLYDKAPLWLRRSHLFNYLLLHFKDQDIFGQLPDLNQSSLRKWSQEKIFLSFVDLRTKIEKQGGEFRVVMMPRRQKQHAYEFIKPFLQKEGIPYLDMSEDIAWIEADSGLWFEIDGHPNLAGYARIAESVYGFLTTDINTE
jgi:lysophospholipase L1-like esterase